MEAPPLLRPGNIVFDTPDPERLSEFWTALTGYVSRPLFGEYLGLCDPTGRGPNLTFQRTEAPVATVTRCHVDFYANDPEAVAERAVALGARIVRRVTEGDVSWVVVCDPDGNHFCIVAAVGPDRST